jgi:hypothetical protein
VNPNDRERQVAREIVIRLKDRRVLSAGECCDTCIDHVVASLQEIRKILVKKQLELSDVQEGPLYLLVDMMALGVRRFRFCRVKDFFAKNAFSSSDGILVS